MEMTYGRMAPQWPYPRILGKLLSMSDDPGNVWLEVARLTIGGFQVTVNDLLIPLLFYLAILWPVPHCGSCFH